MLSGNPAMGLPSSPRTNTAEPLSGVPDPPCIEIAPGRPWLTLAETNRLHRQQGYLNQC